MMKHILILVIAASGYGCAVHATADIVVGHPDRPSADMKAIAHLVCRGDISAAESVLADRGYDRASIIEKIEDARIKCEKK